MLHTIAIIKISLLFPMGVLTRGNYRRIVYTSVVYHIVYTMFNVDIAYISILKFYSNLPEQCL